MSPALKEICDRIKSKVKYDFDFRYFPPANYHSEFCSFYLENENDFIFVQPSGIISASIGNLTIEEVIRSLNEYFRFRNFK